MNRRLRMGWGAGIGIAGALLLAASPLAALARDFSKPIGVSLLPGIPHIIALGVDYRFGPKWSAGVMGGGLPSQTLTIGGQRITMSPLTLQARGRWHPFGGGFLLGLAVGFMRVTASGSADVLVGPVTVPLTVSLEANIPHVTPHFGWMWGLGSGFIFGFEFGVQVPLGARGGLATTLDDPSLQALFEQAQATPENQDLENDIEKITNSVVNYVLPYTTVFRLGFSF